MGVLERLQHPVEPDAAERLQRAGRSAGSRRGTARRSVSRSATADRTTTSDLDTTCGAEAVGSSTVSVHDARTTTVSVLDPCTSTSPVNAATDRPGGRRNRSAPTARGAARASGTACTSRTSVDGVSHQVHPDDAARIRAAAATTSSVVYPSVGVDRAGQVRAPQPELVERRRRPGCSTARPAPARPAGAARAPRARSTWAPSASPGSTTSRSGCSDGHIARVRARRPPAARAARAARAATPAS